MKTIREAMEWLPVKIAAALVIETVIMSFILDIWSVMIR